MASRLITGFVVWRGPLAAGLALACAMACSPANLGSPDAAAEASASQTCANYAYARCTRLQSCSSTQLALVYGDFASCQLQNETGCEETLAAPSTGATPAFYDQCAAAVASPQVDCSDIIFSENDPPACTTPGGALPNGAPCSNRAQCQTGWCSRPAGSDCGACAPLPNPGDPCTLTAQCGKGLTCLPATHTCSSFAQAGSQCGPSQVCSDGLTCVNGACATQPNTMGASCSFAGAGCDEYAGLACNATTGTCQNLVLALPGGACGSGVADQMQACQGGVCVRGMCVGKPALGEPCDLAGTPCSGLASCVLTSDAGTQGICRVLGGSPCAP
jgi:hypothetical protein